MRPEILNDFKHRIGMAIIKKRSLFKMGCWSKSEMIIYISYRSRNQTSIGHHSDVATHLIMSLSSNLLFSFYSFSISPYSLYLSLSISPFSLYLSLYFSLLSVSLSLSLFLLSTSLTFFFPYASKVHFLDMVQSFKTKQSINISMPSWMCGMFSHRGKRTFIVLLRLEPELFELRACFDVRFQASAVLG